MDNKEVFISYKSEEFDDALWVKNTLEENGVSCWMAPMCITGGASYAVEIPAAIQNCKVLVLILSEKVQESKWVPRELDQAINSGKVIMPFMVENCALKDEFSFYLSNIQRYYAYLGKESAMEKMMAEIKNYIGIPEEPAEIIEEPEEAPLLKPEPKKAIKPAAKQKKKTKKPSFKNKRLLTVGGIIAAGVAFIAAITTLLIINNEKQKVVFADATYKKSDYTITVEEKEIDAADMAEFAKFEEMHFVTIKNCSFKTDDLSAFATQDLLTLELSNCQLTDTQLNSLDFEAMERLEALNLNGNEQLTDFDIISPLADTLKKLYINDASIGELVKIKGFINLTHLSIDNTNASDLSFLSEMAYLQSLSANQNKLKTLAGLENTSVLREVHLSNNQLTDVSLLANSADSLSIVSLDNNSIASLSSLANCTKITHFSANGNRLTALDWSSGWSELISLSLAENEIQSINGIAKSQSLVYLNLAKNQLTAIDGLTFKEGGYVDADFSNNRISNAILPTNCNFSTLALHGNPLQNSSFLNGTDGFDISFDYFEAIDTTLLKESKFGKIYITGCPTNRRVELEKASHAVRLVTAEEVASLLAD